MTRHRPQPRRHAAARDRHRARHALGARRRSPTRSALHALVRWIGICDGNMQEGSFRCDANVSVRPARRRRSSARAARSRTSTPSASSSRRSSTRCAARSSCSRTAARCVQETRLYDPDRDETRSMRSKEDAHDYRYFPDPDLLPLAVDAGLDRARCAPRCPNCPPRRRARFVDDATASPPYDAVVLTGVARAGATTSRTWCAAPAASAEARRELGAWASCPRALNRAELDVDRSRRSRRRARRAARAHRRRHASPARSPRTCSRRCGPAKAMPTRSSRRRA